MTAPIRESSALLGDAEALRRRFTDDGYLYLRGVLPRARVTRARSGLLQVLRSHGLVSSANAPVSRRARPWTHWLVPRSEDEARVIKDLQRVRAFHALTHAPAVTSAVELLLQAPTMLHPRKIVRVVFPERVVPDSHVEPHQDYRYLQGSPDLVIGWVPLGVYPERHGGLRVLTGSHHQGLLPAEPRRDQLGIPVPPDDSRWRVGDYRPGDLLLMHGLLVHGALPNESSRLRITLDFRFQACGEPIADEALRAPYPCDPGVDPEDPAAWSFDPWIDASASPPLVRRVPPLRAPAVTHSRFARITPTPAPRGPRMPNKTPRHDYDPRSRCAVLVPIGVHIERECELALQEVEDRGYRVMRLYGHSAIDQARSAMASQALDEGYDELMWIDADIGFDPDDVDRLRAHELPISCGLYAKKGPKEFAFSPLPGQRRLPFGTKGGLHEVLYAGAGFLHTRREVYEDIERACGLPACNHRFDEIVVPYFLPLLVPDGASTWYLGEDFAFCERARQAGHEIIADTTIRLRHIGRYAYTWEDAVGAKRRARPSAVCRIQQPGRVTAAVDYPVGGSVERVLYEALVLAADGPPPVRELLERVARSRAGLADLREARAQLVETDPKDPPGEYGLRTVKLAPRRLATVERLQAYLFGRQAELDVDEASAQADFFGVVARIASRPRFEDRADALAPLLAYGRLMRRAARADARASLNLEA